MFRRFLKTSLNEYGMLVVLMLLCIYYAWATVAWQPGVGSPGGKQCASEAVARSPQLYRVAIVAGASDEDSDFIDAAKYRLETGGVVSDRCHSCAVPSAGTEVVACTHRDKTPAGSSDHKLPPEPTGCLNVVEHISPLVSAGIVTPMFIAGQRF